MKWGYPADGSCVITFGFLNFRPLGNYKYK